MANLNEIWLPVKGYEGIYEVSNLARVKALEKWVKMPKGEGIRHYPESLMNPVKTRQGYYRVKLSKDGKKKMMILHRLVAIAFLPNPQNKATVNHINGIKSDNCVTNLEWATQAENESHAVENKLKTQGERHRFSKKVINIQTGEIFNSATQAAKVNNMNLYTLCDKLNGRTKINNTNLRYYKS